jgi:AP-3 complex subunit delta-1
MDAAIKKAKDSIGQLFDKNMQDLVRGIRNHKENEVFIEIKPHI